jgi:hypothetical protein
VEHHLRPATPVATATAWQKRDEAEQGPRQVIDAVCQVVLNPDADDVPVFFHSPNANGI